VDDPLAANMLQCDVKKEVSSNVLGLGSGVIPAPLATALQFVETRYLQSVETRYLLTVCPRECDDAFDITRIADGPERCEGISK
jgi:hypothetical protein